TRPPACCYTAPDVQTLSSRRKSASGFVSPQHRDVIASPGNAESSTLRSSDPGRLQDGSIYMIAHSGPPFLFFRPNAEKITRRRVNAYITLFSRRRAGFLVLPAGYRPMT